MSWTDKIKRIVVLNLAKREDRLLQFVEQAEKLNLPFIRYEAIYDESQGARGLRDTMVKLFKEEIERETPHLLVFEDDCLFLEDEVVFNNTMDRVISQMPTDYHMIFLGCQITGRIKEFYSDNIFPVMMAYSTHAVLYSLSGMKAVLDSNLGYPIDNHLTVTVQPQGKCYCIYPLLCSQVEGYSDIGKNVHSWRPFIEDRYQQKIIEYKQGMR